MKHSFRARLCDVFVCFLLLTMSTVLCKSIQKTENIQLINKRDQQLEPWQLHLKHVKRQLIDNVKSKEKRQKFNLKRQLDNDYYGAAPSDEDQTDVYSPPPVEDGSDNYGPPPECVDNTGEFDGAAPTGYVIPCPENLYCLQADDYVFDPTEAAWCSDDQFTCGYVPGSVASLVCPNDGSSAQVIFEDPDYNGASHFVSLIPGDIAGAFSRGTTYVDQVSCVPYDGALVHCHQNDIIDDGSGGYDDGSSGYDDGSDNYDDGSDLYGDQSDLYGDQSDNYGDGSEDGGDGY